MAPAPAPSYWQASASPFAGDQAGPVAGEFDVAIVGAGFTGLSAARALAQAGASVALVEAGNVCGEASGRDGGAICTPWPLYLPRPAVPGHFGKPWFLPAIGAWYKLQDRLH